MIFAGALAQKVSQGEKTVTRRLTSDNPRSPWYEGGCKLIVGESYAVTPGRGKHAICRIVITHVDLQTLGSIDDEEARREGFANAEEFEFYWRDMHGGYNQWARVWRVEFVAE